MSSTLNPAPAPAIDYDALLAIHGRLLAHDDRASSELFDAVIAHLERATRLRFPRIDPTLIADAATDACLALINKPDRCRAGTGERLWAFLKVVARRRASNAYRSEKRRAMWEGRAALNARLEADDATVVALATPEGILVQREDALGRVAQVADLETHLPNPQDREIFRLQLAGERGTKVYAAVLGVGHLPIDQQRRFVKLAKDRIDKVLTRARRRS
jgi:DNA-directed RNA polymerase specialized sigma24 family protein